MERVALDTTFLIDLQNERRGRGLNAGATDYLREHPDVELFIPSVALGEFLEGFSDPEDRTAQVFVSHLRVLSVDVKTAIAYARVTRALRASGLLTGSNDLWIGCTALTAHLPLLTRNSGHFQRIAGLEVLTYSP